MCYTGSSYMHMKGGSKHSHAMSAHLEKVPSFLYDDNMGLDFPPRANSCGSRQDAVSKSQSYAYIDMSGTLDKKKGACKVVIYCTYTVKPVLKTTCFRRSPVETPKSISHCRTSLLRDRLICLKRAVFQSLEQSFKTGLITSLAKEVMFMVALVCLSVC